MINVFTLIGIICMAALILWGAGKLICTSIAELSLEDREWYLDGVFNHEEGENNE